ncbi:hypothetical protein TWF281_009639 [Arthrobotrys megalospora]
MAKIKVTGLFKVLVSLLFLVVPGLGAFAWYIVSRYQLPFSVLPIITTIFGPVDALATYGSAFGFSVAKRGSKRPLVPWFLFVNLLLLVLPAVIIALSAPYLGESKCLLKDTWQAWYSAKNEKAVKGVQDSLQCCGFGTAVEMPYPFPFNPKKGDPRPEVPVGTCKTLMRGVNKPCAPLWQAELQTAVGLVVGATAFMFVAKLVYLMIVLGNPKLAERWFARPSYSEYENVRTIENLDDDEEEEEEEERPPPHITTDAGPSGENGANERTRLLLPKDHSRNGHPISMHDENAWS